MLAVGQAWGTGPIGQMPESGVLLMPLDADVTWAAALRELEGMKREQGFFITPPVGNMEHLPFLLEQTVAVARRRSPENPVRCRQRWLSIFIWKNGCLPILTLALLCVPCGPWWALPPKLC